jgi:hypothetical protein
MTNDNPTLIAGFEDIMVHIRNQEKRIKDLEDELYDLREFKKDAEDTCASHVVMEDLMKRVSRAEGREKLTKLIHKETQESLLREKEINYCHVQKIIFLQDTLRCFEKETCDCCEEWYDCEEIECVNDSDYDYQDVCLECRDKDYSQCEECMEYCCNSVMVLVGDRDICSKCNED